MVTKQTLESPRITSLQQILASTRVQFRTRKSALGAAS